MTHADAKSKFAVPVTVGSMDSNDWLAARGLSAGGQPWFVEIALGIGDGAPGESWSGATDTRFQLFIYPQEWGFLFCHGSRTSWIRISDRAYVHGRDEYGLVGSTPPLRDLSAFARELEQHHRIVLRRDRPLVRTNLTADDCVRAWVASL